MTVAKTEETSIPRVPSPFAAAQLCKVESAPISVVKMDTARQSAKRV